MSEYQYYEWQTLSRMLSAGERAQIDGLSTHMNVTPTSASVSYNWSDFKFDPIQVLADFFDAFLYMANWGTRWLAFRLPVEQLSPETVAQIEQYLYADSVRLLRLEEPACWVLAIELEDEASAGWVEGSGRLAKIGALRENIIAGDYRALYLAWLAAMQLEYCDDEAVEPPVPPGLNELTPALKELARFFDLQPALIAAAARSSVPLPPPDAPLDDVIQRLPRAEADAWLLRVLRGENGLPGGLRRRLIDLRNTLAQRAASPRRKWAELQAAAEAAGTPSGEGKAGAGESKPAPAVGRPPMGETRAAGAKATPAEGKPAGAPQKGAQAPSVQTPSVQTPSVQTPSVQTPPVQTPSVHTPGAQPSAGPVAAGEETKEGAAKKRRSRGGRRRKPKDVTQTPAVPPVESAAPPLALPVPTSAEKQYELTDEAIARVLAGMTPKAAPAGGAEAEAAPQSSAAEEPAPVEAATGETAAEPVSEAAPEVAAAPRKRRSRGGRRRKPAAAVSEEEVSVEAAPVEAAPSEAAPSEAAPVEGEAAPEAEVAAAPRRRRSRGGRKRQPAAGAPEEVTPAEAAPTEAAPTEAAPTEAAPLQAATEAAEAPTEAEMKVEVAAEGGPTPVEATPPADEAPAEEAGVPLAELPSAVTKEAVPVEAAPAEAAPAEAAPVEAVPVEAVPEPDQSAMRDPWSEVEAYVARKNARAYDAAVALILQLRDEAAAAGDLPAFEARLADLEAGTANRPAFLDRLHRALA
jgi:hypothetical protein